MDTLTHGIAGALLGRAGAPEGTARAVVATAAVAAMFPDIDAFFLPGSWFRMASTMDYLRYHRGVTHSFALAPFFALGLALLARAVARRTPFKVLFAAALAGIVSHILFDWITSYGTMFFAPFSWRRYALDWVFILDPYFTGIPVAALVASLFARDRGRLVGVAGSIALFGYIGGCAAMHRKALAAGRRLFPTAEISALPQPLSPRRWMILGNVGDAIDVAYVRLGGAAAAKPGASAGERKRGMLEALKESYGPPGQATVAKFPTLRADSRVVAARTFPDVADWSRFARFPIADVQPLPDGGARVTLTDLRFRGPWGRPAFQYEVLIGADGRERTAGFVRLFVVQGETRRK